MHQNFARPCAQGGTIGGHTHGKIRCPRYRLEQAAAILGSFVPYLDTKSMFERAIVMFLLRSEPNVVVAWHEIRPSPSATFNAHSEASIPCRCRERVYRRRYKVHRGDHRVGEQFPNRQPHVAAIMRDDIVDQSFGNFGHADRFFGRRYCGLRGHNSPRMARIFSFRQRNMFLFCSRRQ
jgi:hypothetical protein